ncbi:hypothetical protein ALP8811_03242 [Aliiroseovarius pelagivivens]|uniref:Uncharacterized protein n=1 Tax=Aliiroseovarius pelagivivens TaxID=1639690 RepID=A0A2R8ATA4_9RHOB|nr:hypothetical protein [Aliiroseovarius pelagivivens]SPF79302.1 hypothetical protein ALP8811_03242 [Aliiroseovarius pelagivivens]
MFGKRKTRTPAEELKEGKFRRLCNVYMHRETSRAIVVPMLYDGIYVEDEAGITLCETTPEISFGEIVRDHFKASRRGLISGLGARKKTDWPAFKTSGLRSVAQFEREYICVSVMGANEANIIVRLESDPVQWGLKITTHCNPLSVEVLGSELNKIRKHFLKWEKA